MGYVFMVILEPHVSEIGQSKERKVSERLPPPIRAEVDDPFDDFEEDDFDDDFDDDFEEDWEDDLTEDDEFPDTFGGHEDDEDDTREKSPFSDDPEFDTA